MESESREERNVIPRWRSLAALEERDLASAQRFKSVTQPHRPDDFKAWVGVWKEEGSLAAASDLFDLYALTGDKTSLASALKLFERQDAEIPPRLREALKVPFEKRSDPLELRRSINYRETDETYVRRSIRVLKTRIRAHSRDALAHLELARLYAILGAHHKAEGHLELARALAPDDRVILRATLQFYDIVEDLSEGLRIIRQSERLKFDPWIQSGEIAASTLLGKESRVASRGLVSAIRGRPIERERSELAMAMASLEWSWGVKERKIFQLVGQALPHSTENGLAQAIWLSDHSSRLFLDRFPEATPSSEAYEAKVEIALQQKDFEGAAGFAQLWVEDQPFSVDAIIRFLNLHSVHVAPDAFAVQTARRAMNVHQENWQVLNACLLVLAEARQFDDADLALSRLSRATPSGPPQAFVEAATGFLAFHKDDIAGGRAGYERAISMAREAKRQNLLINAAMFWLRCEILSGFVSDEFVDDISKTIDLSLEKAKGPDVEHLRSTWISVKKIVDGRNEREDVENPLQKILARVLKEGLKELTPPGSDS